MASAVPPFSLDEFRASVRRMQAEGEKLVGRIRRDAKSLVRNGPRSTVSEALADVRRLRSDVRERAREAFDDLRAQRARVAEAVDDFRGRVVDTIALRLGIVTAERFEELSRRVDRLENASRKEAAA
jgi:hypothetical protein